MPIGYVTGNQGESRYTVAIPRKTPLLAALIEARRVEIEGIDLVLEELRKHEKDRRETYDAAMTDVREAVTAYTECRESYTEPQCRSNKIAEANDAYSSAMDACWDTWRDCRGGCDIGDGDCSDACSEARDACEDAAKVTRDRALAAVDRLCVDALVAHLQACQAEHAPIIAAAQAAAVDALAPLQDAMIAITWERTKRTAAVRRLNELEAIESSAEMATCWSAQYNADLKTGEVPEEPTGDEENAVIVATVSGRAVITEISSVNPCAHDSRALPADVLFVDAALAPGAETWRPTWRTGTVTEIYDPAEPGDWPDPEKPLRVRINPAILPGTLGTRVSRRDINCTPPGAFFDEDGELDARLGIARQEYDDAIEARDEILAEIQTCKDGYTVRACTEPRNEVCEYNREQSMIACIDNRDYCLSIAQDANGVQYCLDQFNACEQQVEAIFSACVDGATADCIDAKRQHDTQCEQTSQFDLSQAETAVSTALRNLLNAAADIQGPPAELIRELPVAHCSASIYEVGDDVLIDFPARATSTGLDWATATSAQIRAAAMAVWQSARVVGWASETRECAIPQPYFFVDIIFGEPYECSPAGIFVTPGGQGSTYERTTCLYVPMQMKTAGTIQQWGVIAFGNQSGSWCGSAPTVAVPIPGGTEQLIPEIAGVDPELHRIYYRSKMSDGVFGVEHTFRSYIYASSMPEQTTDYRTDNDLGPLDVPDLFLYFNCDVGSKAVAQYRLARVPVSSYRLRFDLVE